MKEFLKGHPFFLDLFALAFNLMHSPSAVFCRKIHCRGAFLKKVKLDIARGSVVEIGRMARLTRCTFSINAPDCKVVIGGNHTKIANAVFCCQDGSSRIVVGDDFTLEGGEIASIEGKEVIIGRDCMFSFDVDVRNGDSHVILDGEGRRINYSEDISFGDHVWLAAHTRVLKGSIIPSNCIIGNSAVVSGRLENENSLYAGIPAKLIKENVGWDRFRNNYPENEQTV